jgi:hypothetical protein
MKKLLAVFALALMTGWLSAQSTAVSTTGVVDHDGNTWTGGTYSIQFSPNPQNPSIGSYVWAGGNLQNNLQFNGTLDNAGAFNVTIPDSTTITPAGSAWNFIICPNATTGCFTTRTPVFGSTFNITTQLNALAVGPRFPVSVSAHGYADVEINPIPLPGGTYYNVTTNFIRVWSGTAWSNIGGGGGSGQVLPSPQFQVGYFPSPGTVATVQGVPSAFTTDSVGNVRTKSNDGLLNAFGTQTTPTSNNGIQNALQTLGNYVVAGPDYGCTEGTYSNPNGYRLGIGSPAPFANATLLIDQRQLCGTQGSYSYNTIFNLAAGTWVFDRWVQNQQPLTSGGGNFVFPYLRDFEMTPSGKNSFVGGGPDSFGAFQWNFELNSAGIVSGVNIEQQDNSVGDNHIYATNITNNRGSTDGAGEGFDLYRDRVIQNLTPMATTANSTLAAGATLIQGTLLSNVPFVGDQQYYIDASKGGAVCNILSETAPGALGANSAGQWLTDCTFTPDNIGRVAGSVSPAKQYNGLTTNITVNITGLTSGIVAGTVGYSDAEYDECANVVSTGSFSGGTATGAVIALKYGHGPNAYVSQGPNACNFEEIRANRTPTGLAWPGRQLVRVIGASTTHTILYASTLFGVWQPMVNNLASTMTIAPAGATLTRTSNVTSVLVGTPGSPLHGDSLFTTGCTDTTFNVQVTSTGYDGTTMSWPNAGANGTTTCTGAVEILSNNAGSGISVRSIQMFPGALIVNPIDPTTHANNFNITVEPNKNLQVTAGDQLESQNYAHVVMGFHSNFITFQSQTSPGSANIMYNDGFNGSIPSGFIFQQVAVIDPFSHYLDMGGTKPVGATLLEMGGDTTPFLHIFNNLPVPTASFVNFQTPRGGCWFSTDCSSVKDQFQLFGWGEHQGFHLQQVLQNTGIVETTDVNSTTNDVFDLQEGIGIFDVHIHNGLAFPSNLETTFEVVPGTIAAVVIGGANTATFLWQPTTFSSTVPYTQIGAGTGVACFTSGVLAVGSCAPTSFITSLTTTGTSGPATVTSGVLNIPQYSGGGGSGTVTTFSAGSLSPLFTTSVATATTTPALTFTLSNAAANTVFGNFTGAAAGPTFAAVPSCSTSTSALIWTSGTGLGCHTISASSVAWSAITVPTTSLSLSMASNSTVFGFGAATGSSDMFLWNDSASNTGTGILGHFHTATGSTEIPWQADANNVGFQITAAGTLASVGATASGFFALSGSSSGTATVTVAAAAGTPTLTLPTATGTLTETIARGQTAIPVTALAANTCDASATTATATGALTTDAVTVSYASDPTGVTGYGGGTSGGITISAWFTANTFNFKRCNQTGLSITPGALNLNWLDTR